MRAGRRRQLTSCMRRRLLCTFISCATHLSHGHDDGRREDAFGHGVLDISADGRIAHWVWKSNTGSHAVSTDSFTLRRDVTECPLRAFGTQ